MGDGISLSLSLSCVDMNDTHRSNLFSYTVRATD
jgi:hypothetical protein